MKNRILVGFSEKGKLASRVEAFARENELSKAGAVRLLVKEALDRRDGGEKTRQGKGPAG